MSKKTVSVMTSLVTVLSTAACAADMPPQDVCQDWELDENGGYVCEDDGEFIDIDGKKKKKKGIYYYGGSMFSGKTQAISSGAFSKSSGFGSGTKGMG